MYQWHVVTIGHLSRNRFWGEEESRAYRRPLATCTLLHGEGEAIVVDPSLPPDGMAEAVWNASGIHADEVTAVYSTHFHFDHHVSAQAFPNARWYMAGADMNDMLRTWDEYSAIWPLDDRAVAERFVAAKPGCLPDVELVALPGHTEGLQGLLFDAPEGKVLLTGDAVMTKEFFRAGEPYFFGWNHEKARQSIQLAASLARVIVLGHGEAFDVDAWRPEMY